MSTHTGQSKISDETISSVRDRTDIVQEIGSRITLKKSGATFIGLCPFHGEKTASFHVSPVRQRFHCFGCDADGDTIEFLMQHDGMDFQEAIEDLASRVGVIVQREQTSTPPHTARVPHQTYQTLTDVSQRAAEHYRRNLSQDPLARAYAASRQLSQEIKDTYGIGFASGSSDGLRTAFPDYDNNADLIKAGLVVLMADGPHQGRRFDRFRDRLMFPIRDTKGRVIGFGGRIIHSNNPKAAKYLNSPETELFSKHKVLYGLHEARSSIMRAKQAFVVEGYMDVVAMAMHGIPNTVAAMGTALTEDHARLLLRFTRNICFLFDGDSAGQKAAWKTAQTVLPLMQPGINISFLTLPDNQDPDEYLRIQGKTAFTGLVASRSQSLTTFLISRLLDIHGQMGRLDSLESKANFARDAIELARQIPSNNPLATLLFNEIKNLSGVTTQSTKTTNPEPRASTSHESGEHKRPWLPPDQYRVMRQAQTASSPTAANLYRPSTFPPLGTSPYTRPAQVAPTTTPRTIWQQIIQAVRTAPSFAFANAHKITAPLNQEMPEELDVLMAFDALEASDEITDPPNIPEDMRLAAIDLLTNAPALIQKQRRQATLENLKRMKDSGEMGDEMYLAEISKSVSPY